MGKIFRENRLRPCPRLGKGQPVISYLRHLGGLKVMALLSFRTGGALALVFVSLSLTRADSPPIVHYAPVENLEHLDVALLDRAERKIDIAAYDRLACHFHLIRASGASGFASIWGPSNLVASKRRRYCRSSSPVPGLKFAANMQDRRSCI
jgi:hypothetical protein